MKLLACSWDARSASLTKSFMGHDIIKVGAKKFSLPEDIVKTHVSAEQNEMTALRMLLIIVLAITLIGLLFAIPLYFLSKKKAAHYGIQDQNRRYLYRVG
ncbi:MAG TPA: hypothetical protein P5102_04795 [Candidatus Competibacteraceae bacterium]|nr:hypothetical protein [Candidatus Competibacteraceae bacterium]HRZ05460.1 hypothetical protein [Candidatus Competibacteraceae bacterium]HSA45952.1 hypothetical protein [Candidatus Competibacteraceae bacterium]